MPGQPQPQRRLDADGRYFDAMPGGVALLTKSDIPYFRTPLIAEYEEENRRALAVTLLPGQGLEPIRVYQIYGFARARDDHERMILNENFLGKIFQDANANGRLPVVIMGDFNTDPLSSAKITQEVNSGGVMLILLLLYLKNVSLATHLNKKVRNLGLICVY